MASGIQTQERVSANLQKKLALAVRSIQWSYAIFWSISASESESGSGVLEWGDGYYNGDIKTRKTVQSMEGNADKMDLQRSEQLRELFESLSAGENSPQARRPSAALSPEDLTDTEWYYLVCMSFVFDIGQGLPGRTLAKGQPIWLCNAHNADSKEFTRSLLAKSASIKTVVCFPFMGGVVELGVTDQVLEDPGIIQHIKTSYLDTRNDTYAAADDKHFDMKLVPIVGSEELGITSPNNSSNGFQTKQFGDDSFLLEEMNRSAFQVQSWQFIDEELNIIHDSMTSSDCISQSFVNPEKVVSIPKYDNIKDHHMPDLVKLLSLNHQNDDVHYQTVLSTLLKSSNQLLIGPHIKKNSKGSSFISWKKGGRWMNYPKPSDDNTQRVLKRVLFAIPRMYVGGLLESPQRLNEKYYVLKSIIPSASKPDKVSILNNTIEYLKELEKRVKDLESCRELTESKARTKRKPRDTAERTSDNYGNETIGKKLLINKRKPCNFDDETRQAGKDGSSENLIVSWNDKDVVIEIRCSWREGLLLEIMDTMRSLYLDSHSVQSSINDGILSLAIEAKFKESTISSLGMIKQAIQRITKC